MTALNRFWKFVDKTDDCWIWSGWKSHSGYGRFAVSEKQKVQAHRFAYEQLIGPIPTGLQLDHICKNRLCVNPAHLEPVTPSVNVSRGASPQILRDRAAAVTHCPMGHPYSEENTYRDGKGRDCKICRRRRSQEFRRRNGVKEHPKLVVNGTGKTVKEWAALVGLNRNSINKRLKKGWTPKEAVFGKL